MEPRPKRPGMVAGAVRNRSLSWAAACSGNPTRSMLTISRSSNRIRTFCPKSRFLARARCIFAPATPAVLATAYKDLDQFWSDTIKVFTKELHALAQAGCRYVQIDETAFAKFGDPDVQASLAARGDDWSRLVDKYIDVTNRITCSTSRATDRHASCRGNCGGHWHAEGGYEQVAERLFNALNIDFLFLEYDLPRAPGNFTPLRFVPKLKSVVLGLVSTKSPELEDMGDLSRRIDEATKFVALDRLAVSPQCGFASVDTGNPVTPDAQKRKSSSWCAILPGEIWGDTRIPSRSFLRTIVAILLCEHFYSIWG